MALDTRYIILGANIMAVSVLIGIYGYIVASTQLIGVSLSSLLIGAIITVLGFSYDEPTTSLLIDYSRVLSKSISTVLEDLRLSNMLPSTFVKDGKIYLILSNMYPENIDVLNPGVNIVDGNPIYITMLKDTVRGESSLDNLYDIESRLKDILVREYGICDRLELVSGEEGLRLRLYGVDRRILEVPLTPFNPLDLMVIMVSTDVIGRGLITRNRVIEGDSYVVEFTVV